jgi:hypothetical protein
MSDDDRPWFRPKAVGWGVTPARWQGWATTAVLLGAMFFTSMLRDPGGSRPSQILFYTHMRAVFGLSQVHIPNLVRLILMAVEVAAFLGFARTASRPLKPLD